jgi:MoxR-like ATPase
VALYRAAQASAFLEGRDFVLPDDVAGIAPAVLAHRILLDVDRELRGATADRVVAQLVASTPLPIARAL